MLMLLLFYIPDLNLILCEIDLVNIRQIFLMFFILSEGGSFFYQSSLNNVVTLRKQQNYFIFLIMYRII